MGTSIYPLAHRPNDTLKSFMATAFFTNSAHHGERAETKYKLLHLLFTQSTAYSSFYIFTHSVHSKSVLSELIKEISSMFSIKESDSMEIIGKWVEDRYKLKIAHFRGLQVVPINGLKIN